jgi:hypothetical protein
MEHGEKIYFPQGGMLKFTYKGNFLTIKKAYKKNYIENPNNKHMLWCVFYIHDLFFEKD